MTQLDNKNIDRGEPHIILGGIELKAGCYLKSGTAEITAEKPDAVSGYGYYDGTKLILHNYRYSGSGLCEEDVSIGLLVQNGSLKIHVEGSNTILIDAIEKGIGIKASECTLVIDGKGSLTVNAQNGKKGNYGISSDSSVKLRNAELRISAGLPKSYVRKGIKKYSGESYALYIKSFDCKGAKVTGNDQNGGFVNKNNAQEAVYTFPHHFLWIPILLSAAAVCACGIGVWAIFFRTPTVLTPDYAPASDEENAELITDEEDTEKLESSKGGGAISISYSVDIAISLSNQTVALYYANPSSSNQNTIVQLIIQDNVIAESGIMKPGTQVTQLSLENDVSSKLAAGGYDGLLRISSYDPDTGEKAIMTSDIAITAAVQ